MNEFSILGLSKPLIDAIEELGFIQPTPIQSKAIPELLQNDTDLVGLAQTGTGKTAAFGLPLVELVETSERHTQALILAPTRELCLQIANELKQFGKHFPLLKIVEVYGGADIGRQIREVKKGAQIIVATPGRLRDMINRRAVNLNQVEYVVLDEADEMLNMGFKQEIDDILDNTPEDKLTWLFSATMPEDVRRISLNYMSNPLELNVGSKNTANDDIDHQYVVTRPSERYEVLRRYLDFDSEIFALVFCRTRRDSKELADQLARDGYNADALHGDLNQAQRDRVMDGFRTGRLRVLIATDVAARGIDVNDITHVFHFNIPEDRAFYTHRSGRTGRAGKKGISLVLCHPKDLHLIREIERKLKVVFSKAHIPTGEEICQQRLKKYFRQIKNAPIQLEIKDYLPEIIEDLEALSKEELLEKVASLSFNRFFQNYRYAADLNRREKTSGKTRNQLSEKTRLFINIGNIDVDGKGGFLSFICETADIPGSMVGRIKLREKYCFFDVETEVAEQVIYKLNNSRFGQRKIRINFGDQSGVKRKKKKAIKNKKR